MTKLTWRDALKFGLRIFGYQVAFAFIGFMIIPGMLSMPVGIRLPIIGLLVAAAGVLMFSTGSAWGERDTAMSQTLDRLQQGTYTPSADEEAKRYHRIKGVIAGVIGALITFLAAVAVAVTAKPYAYQLQDLPTWMQAYTPRAEIGGALAYMMKDPVSPSVFDYLRIFVRFMLFPYVGLFGEMGDEMSLLFDRISPLLALVMPMLTAIGYQFGPRRHARSVKLIEQAKNTPRKRLKKDREKKNSGPREKKQLV